MNRNLTLTLDEELLRAARKVALDRNTSVNSLVREYLTEITTQDDRKAKALATLERFFEERPLRLGKVTWTRDDLYDRKG